MIEISISQSNCSVETRVEVVATEFLTNQCTYFLWTIFLKESICDATQPRTLTCKSYLWGVEFQTERVA